MATEDFTTYTEVDPGDDITRTSTTVSWSTEFNSRGGGDSYVYYDKGANFFSGNFIHTFILRRNWAQTGYTPYHWLLANIVDDYQGIKDASEDAVGVRVYYATGPSGGIYLNLVENGTQYQDGWSSSGYPPLDTDHYITVSRDDDGGVNGTGRYTVRICHDNYYGQPGADLKDTLQLDCSAGEQNDFRYIYGICNVNTGDTYCGQGSTRDLNLSPITLIPVVMHHLRQQKIA